MAQYINERDFRLYYEMGIAHAEHIKNLIEENGSASFGKQNPILFRKESDVPHFLLRKDTLQALRRSIREVSHDRGYTSFEGDRWQYVRTPDSDGYDSAIYKCFFKGVHLTEEEKQESIEDMWEHWYNPYEDGRDCTGVWFTSHISVFDVPEGTWVYHFKSCDV